MTLSDPVYKVTVLFKGEYLKNSACYRQSYYRTLLGNHRQRELGDPLVK